MDKISYTAASDKKNFFLAFPHFTRVGLWAGRYLLSELPGLQLEHIQPESRILSAKDVN
jgi:hypothetical protein